MKIYNYDKVNGQYVGESYADQSPLESDVWLIPAYATTVLPLEQQENKIVCFVDGSWVYQELEQGSSDEASDHFADQPKQSLAEMIIANPTELSKLKSALGIA